MLNSDLIYHALFVIYSVYTVNGSEVYVADDDYMRPKLTHTAIQKVPAVLRESVEIR